jgi:hypothetical protein
VGQWAGGKLKFAFFSCCDCFVEECQALTISTGSIQDNGEKSIRLAKSFISILRRPRSFNSATILFDKVGQGHRARSLPTEIEGWVQTITSKTSIEEDAPI